MKLQHGTYVGDAVLSLQGEGALIISLDDTTVKVQFDNKSLGNLAFGWHIFSASDFKINSYEEELEPSQILQIRKES